MQCIRVLGWRPSHPSQVMLGAASKLLSANWNTVRMFYGGNNFGHKRLLCGLVQEELSSCISCSEGEASGSEEVHAVLLLGPSAFPVLAAGVCSLTPWHTFKWGVCSAGTLWLGRGALHHSCSGEGGCPEMTWVRQLKPQRTVGSSGGTKSASSGFLFDR